MLLKMLDSPEDYSEAQWDEILSDKECINLYNDIARIRGAVKANYNSLTDKEIAHEWQKLSGKENFLEKPNGNRSNIFLKSWQRVAAIAAAVVVVSGFAYAAVSTHFFGIASKPAKPAKVEQSAKPSDYYGVEVEYKDEDVKGLRLYFEWNPDEPLTGIISTLNNFESFSIKLEGKKIIVSKAKQL